MAERYDPKRIEAKWQAYWEQAETFRTDVRSDKPKAYILDMFPYPSGSGLHVGHPEGYTATDIMARYARAQGKEVLHPMGWDAFGLPAEQHAIRTGTHPRETTRRNIDNFRRQLKSMGFSYDWSREVDTTSPDYVRWTQWIFLKLFERGLAYQQEVPVNWCAALGTVLANEEVKDGRSEIGNHPVERLPLRQWVLRITAYADRLLDDLKLPRWPASTQHMQTEWIGRSEGAEVRFGLPDGRHLEVFTTRPDTLFGVTFLALAPEHPWLEGLLTEAQRKAANAYIAQAKHRSDLDRKAAKDKSGVFSGAFATHPLTGEAVPIWIADYVLADYGSGAVMGVPAHDLRDLDFARAHELPVRGVVAAKEAPETPLIGETADDGISVNSPGFNGQATAEMKRAIIDALEAREAGSRRTQYRLRDWVFARQRYWGEPIPIYFPVATEGDPRQGAAYTIDYSQPRAVELSELPLTLPELEDFRPGEDPAGALARALDWRFFERDGQWYARETNTMPQWAGSCWYYLRYIDPQNTEALADPELLKRWLPVDLYVGGAEHAVLHLLYARFWHKVLFDLGVVPTKEPFGKLVHQGMILGELEFHSYRDAQGTAISKTAVTAQGSDGVVKRTGAPVTLERVAAEAVEKDSKGHFVLKAQPEVELEARAYKMSKSRGNVVNPDEIIEAFGADAMRIYEMFMGPLEATKPWNTASIQGVKRFLDRVYTAVMRADSDTRAEGELHRLMHLSIQKVSEDIEAMRFNTAVSSLMVFSNALTACDKVPKDAAETITRLLHPFAPHLAEELWEGLGHAPSLQTVAWPAFDPGALEVAEVQVPVQVNGKVRGRLTLGKGLDEASVLAEAKALEGVATQLEGKTLHKVIWVQDKILTLVAR